MAYACARVLVYISKSEFQLKFKIKPDGLPIFPDATQSCLLPSPNVEISNLSECYFRVTMIAEDILYDKDFLCIYHESEHKLIHLRWKGYASTENLRDALNFAWEAVKEHHIEYWLGNLKLMEAISPADIDWVTESWYPRISATNLKKMAIVTSLDYFNNIAVKKIVNTAADVTNFETRYFVDVTTAKEWLIINS